MPVKRSNGAGENPMSAFLHVLQNPGANSFLMSQRVSLEAARFWAKRMHAYADQMETLAACTSPEQFASANTRFFDRLREDYSEEGAALRALMALPGPEERAEP